MSASINSLGSTIDSAYDILKNEFAVIKETLQCPITMEKMENVMALTPCMHRVSEVGWNQMKLAQTEQKCPLCRKKITGVFSDPVFKSTLGDLERKLEKVTQLLESAKMNIPSNSTSSKGKETLESEKEANNNNNAISNFASVDKSVKSIEASIPTLSVEQAINSIQQLHKDIDELSNFLSRFQLRGPFACNTFLLIYNKFNVNVVGFDASILKTKLCRFAYFFALNEKFKGIKSVQEGWGKLAIEERMHLPETERLTNHELESLWIKAVYVFQLNFYIHLVQNDRIDVLEVLSKDHQCCPVFLKNSRSSKVLLDAMNKEWPEIKNNQGVELMKCLASNQVSKTEKIKSLNAVLKICLETWEKPI